MINRSTFIKKLMQTYIIIVSGSILNVSTVRLNGIWHLIWRYLSKPVLGGHPVLSGHYSIPRGCPLKTGFTVHIVLVWMVENGRKSIKMKTMNENIAGACVCNMRIEFNSFHKVQICRFRTFFRVDSRKRVKTVVWTRIDRCVFNDDENAYFWRKSLIVILC